jgi:hypothetical protein
LPLIVEYISNYTIGASDLSRATDAFLKEMTLGEIKTSYVHINNGKGYTKYIGTHREVT